MQQKCLQKTFLERFFKVRNQNSQNSFYTKNFDCSHAVFKKFRLYTKILPLWCLPALLQRINNNY